MSGSSSRRKEGEFDIIAADRHPTCRRKTLGSTTSLSPPITNASCALGNPHMSRAQIVETRNENMESVVEVEIHVGFRRRFSISPSLLTTLTGAASGSTVVSQPLSSPFLACNWSKDRSGHRRPDTVPHATAGGIVLPRVCCLHNSPAKQHGTAHPATPDDGVHSTGATGARVTQS
jgi:hypothetical protein